MPSTANTFERGETIGDRYTVLRVLGKGGFGIVYHVRAHRDNREYALKTFLRSSGDRKAIARFRQEAEIWVALGAHPYLVQAFFVDEIDGRLYVGMEMIPPGPNGLNDLDGYLKQSSPDLRQILIWAVQICHGMEYAASRGIRSHRDLKPANIMINASREVKISDFGLATQPGASDAAPNISEAIRAAEVFKGQTMRGIGFGTPTHMPPEQFQDAAACDARSDIYAVGVMLYQLVTGELPVRLSSPKDASLEARLKFWKEMEEAHLSFQMPRIDSPLGPVLAKCITPDPENRYFSFRELRSDLSSLLEKNYHISVAEPVVEAMRAEDWTSRGLSFERLHRFNEGLHSYAEAIKLNPRMVDAWIGQGRCLRGVNKPSEGIESLNLALEISPESAHARASQAGCLHDMGRLRDALLAYKEAVAVSPDSADTWAGRGDLLVDLEDRNGAMINYDRALLLNPRHVGALTNKGVLLADSDNHTDALVYFEAALEIHDAYAPAARGRAGCLVYLGHSQRAKRHIATLERDGDMSSQMFVARAITLADLEQFTAAMASLDQANDPEVRLATSLLRVRILVGQKHMEDALERLESLAQHHQLPFEVQLQYMILLHACGRSRDALTMVGALLREREGDVGACCAAACAGMGVGMDQEALQACVYGLAAHPNSFVLHFNQGIVLSVLGRYQDAMNSFYSATQLRPFWSDAWFNFGFSALRSGRAKEGVDAVNRALEYERSATSFWNEATSFAAARMTLLRDEFRMLTPGYSIPVLGNGWSPRYRIPHLRPALLLFPIIHLTKLAR